jgi:ribose 5-phosphate isomerase B
MKIAIGSDHAGFPLKEPLLEWLVESGHEVIDVGTDSNERCDYPVFGSAVGRAVASGDAQFGIAVCGSGQGICMAVNKVDGARGGILRDVYDAEMTRRHNDANVACLGSRVTPFPTAKELISIFLATPFEGGRHAARVEQLR